jgi:hypothetical protein
MRARVLAAAALETIEIAEGKEPSTNITGQAKAKPAPAKAPPPAKAAPAKGAGKKK